jgi:hypothetical protein
MSLLIDLRLKSAPETYIPPGSQDPCHISHLLPLAETLSLDGGEEV